MKENCFGRTGLLVSELCLGTMNFGWTIDRTTAFALLDTYHAAGGLLLQSVHVCTDQLFMSDTIKAPEVWLGEWIRERSVARDKLVISARLALLEVKQLDRKPLRVVLKRCCETLLSRIGTSYIDLLIVEWSNDFLPMEEITHAFSEIKKAGLVRHIAIANAPLWRVMEAMAVSSTNWDGVDGLQTGFAVQSGQDTRSETLELCQSYNLGLLVTSALGGARMRLRRLANAHDLRPDVGTRDPLLRTLATVAVQREGSIEQAALAWALSHRKVTSVVTSANSPGQLNELIRATEWNLTGESFLNSTDHNEINPLNFSPVLRLSRLHNPKRTS